LPEKIGGTQGTTEEECEYVLLESNGKIPLGRFPSEVITSSGGVMSNSTALVRDTDANQMMFFGGSAAEKGAHLGLRGKDFSNESEQGSFLLAASKGEGYKVLIGTPDGALNWSGKSHTSWSMPGSVYVDLTTTNQAITTFTAPADGWYTLLVKDVPNYVNTFCVNSSTGVGYSSTANGVSEVRISCPARKGDTVRIYRNGTVDYCRFVYANGTP
jgi:hypothetical protein